ncbi:DUF6232 family protein [Rhodopila sp.]|uniref:DUF6232 family protein n=1 Tax=Rhodopila sp. TaxID=2480087 RepID=UPI003D11F5E9
MSATIDNDEMIFRDDKISVSKTLVRAGSSSYPINGIGSVNIVRPNPGGIFFAVVCAGVTIALATSGSIEGFGMMVGTFITIMAIASGLKVALVFRTASGNQQALTSFSSAYLSHVKNAIEEAVARRG